MISDFFLYVFILKNCLGFLFINGLYMIGFLINFGEVFISIMVVFRLLQRVVMCSVVFFRVFGVEKIDVKFFLEFFEEGVLGFRVFFQFFLQKFLEFWGGGVGVFVFIFIILNFSFIFLSKSIGSVQQKFFQDIQVIFFGCLKQWRVLNFGRR